MGPLEETTRMTIMTCWSVVGVGETLHSFPFGFSFLDCLFFLF